VLYSTARSPEPHSAAALYSSYSGRRLGRPTKLDGTPDMRYSANRAFAGPEFANDRQHARTKAFCDEHGLGHMWPQLQKIGVNTPADIAALRSADLYHLAQLPGSEGLGRTPAQPLHNPSKPSDIASSMMQCIEKVKRDFEKKSLRAHGNQSGYRHLGSCVLGVGGFIGVHSLTGQMHAIGPVFGFSALPVAAVWLGWSNVFNRVRREYLLCCTGITARD
jgi:hypothetical protein